MNSDAAADEDLLDVMTAHLGLFAPGAAPGDFAAAYGVAEADAVRAAETLRGQGCLSQDGVVTDAGWARIEAFMARFETPLPPRFVFEAEHAGRGGAQ